MHVRVVSLSLGYLHVNAFTVLFRFDVHRPDDATVSVVTLGMHEDLWVIDAEQHLVVFLFYT